MAHVSVRAGPEGANTVMRAAVLQGAPPGFFDARVGKPKGHFGFLAHISHRVSQQIGKPTLAIIQPHHEWKVNRRFTQAVLDGSDESETCAAGGSLAEVFGKIPSPQINVPSDGVQGLKRVGISFVDVVIEGQIETLPEKHWL